LRTPSSTHWLRASCCLRENKPRKGPNISLLAWHLSRDQCAYVRYTNQKGIGHTGWGFLNSQIGELILKCDSVSGGESDTHPIAWLKSKYESNILVLIQYIVWFLFLSQHFQQLFPAHLSRWISMDLSLGIENRRFSGFQFLTDGNLPFYYVTTKQVDWIFTKAGSLAYPLLKSFLMPALKIIFWQLDFT
jgi:hypothetical protein